MPLRQVAAATALFLSSVAMGLGFSGEAAGPQINSQPVVEQNIGNLSLQLAADSEPPPPPPDHCTDYDNMKAGHGNPTNQNWFNYLNEQGYARVTIACKFGWGGDQYDCLDQLWGPYESNWNRLAKNPHSTAKGIWMGLERTRKNYMGMNYDSDDGRTQVDGGLPYVRDVRGDPCKALAFRKSHGYY